VTRLMNKARREFYSEFIDAHSGNEKKLFTATMKLINQSRTRDLLHLSQTALYARAALASSSIERLPIFENSLTGGRILLQVRIKLMLQQLLRLACRLFLISMF
jgi:hypothetical protein